MAQNRNEHGEAEESEYRFSDDEVSYEIEDETQQKTPDAISSDTKFKNPGLKRILISCVIFIILIVVVYKILAPKSKEAVDITTVPVVKEMPPKERHAPTLNRAMEVSNRNPAIPTNANSNNQAYNNPPSTLASSGLATNNLPTNPMTLPINRNNETFVGEAEAKMAAMAAENEKRINQIYNDYNQRLNDYAILNKQLQDQVQMLTAKMGSIETQLNQLTQVLMRDYPKNAAKRHKSTTGENIDENPNQDEVMPANYSVQAIIPGRAWLKADNGETITVAEGETIKGLGRVTKIDPYDGIVEVNTGNKALSLSYGGNG